MITITRTRVSTKSRSTKTQTDMTGKTQIALTDRDGEVRYFTQDSLLEQMAGANIPGTAPIKAAMRNLADQVREMRTAQKDYFAAQFGSAEKNIALTRAKTAEAKVDKMLTAVGPLIERML